MTLDETACQVPWVIVEKWDLLVCLVPLVPEVLRANRALMVWQAILVLLATRENQVNPEKTVMVLRAPKANPVIWVSAARPVVEVLVVELSVVLLLVLSIKKVNPDTAVLRETQVLLDLMDKLVFKAQRASRAWLANVDHVEIVDPEGLLVCQEM